MYANAVLHCLSLNFFSQSLMMMLSGSSRLSFTLTPKKDRPEICPNASKAYFRNLEQSCIAVQN